MSAFLKEFEKEMPKKSPEKISKKEQKDYDSTNEIYNLSNIDKISIKRFLNHKKKKIDEINIYSNINKKHSLGSEKEKENIKNEIFLINKYMKHKNISKNKKPKETELESLKKKNICLTNLRTSINIQDFYVNTNNHITQKVEIDNELSYFVESNEKAKIKVSAKEKKK